MVTDVESDGTMTLSFSEPLEVTTDEFNENPETAVRSLASRNVLFYDPDNAADTAQVYTVFQAISIDLY